MGAIYPIGTLVYPNEGERLFMHHMADGFAIVGDFGEPSSEQPLDIEPAPMQHMARNRTFAAVAAAEVKGDFSTSLGATQKRS